MHQHTSPTLGQSVVLHKYSVTITLQIGHHEAVGMHCISEESLALLFPQLLATVLPALNPLHPGDIVLWNHKTRVNLNRGRQPAILKRNQQSVSHVLKPASCLFHTL